MEIIKQVKFILGVCPSPPDPILRVRMRFLDLPLTMDLRVLL